MANFVISVNDEAVQASFRRAPPAVGRHAVRRLQLVGQGLVSYVRRQKLSGQVLNVRTGEGRRSIFSRVVAAQRGATLVVGADLSKAPYMRIHERGGTVTPKRSRFLTIPVGQALTGKGVPRFSARELLNSPGAFGFSGAFFAKGVLFGKVGDAITPLFALKRSVQIRGTGYLTESLSERRAWVRQQLNLATADALAEATGAGGAG